MRVKVNWRTAVLVAVFGVFLFTGSTTVMAAADQLTPPSLDAVTLTKYGLKSQSPMGGSSQFARALSTSATTATTAQQYAVVRAGQSVNVYGSFKYSGWGGESSVSYVTVLAGSGISTQQSKEVYKQSDANLKDSTSGASATAINGTASPQSIGYTITAPSAVTQPTWVYFQVWNRGPGSLGVGRGSYLASSVFQILVLPTTYKLTSTLTPQVAFRGSTLQSALTSTLPAGLAALTPQTTASSGAGTWSGSTFTAAGVGTATAEYDFPVSVPYPATGTAENLLTSQTAYIGNIADQSTFAKSDVTFSIDLPAGLTADNITWRVNGETQSSTNTELVLANVGTSLDGATVTATMDVSGDGITAKGVVGTATLTVKDTPYNVTADSHILFSGNDVTAQSNQAKLQAWLDGQSKPLAGSESTWTVSDPTLGTVDEEGTFTANKTGKTGIVEVSGTHQVGTQLVKSDVAIQIARIPQPDPVPVGGSVTLTAPDPTSGEQWQYFWMSSPVGVDSFIPITDPNAMNQNYTLQVDETTAQKQYRVMIIQPDNENSQNPATTIYSNAVTPTVGDASVKLASVPDFTFYDGSQPDGQRANPTVGQLLSGQFSGATTAITNTQANATALLQQWLQATQTSPLTVTSAATTPQYQVTASLSQFRRVTGQDAAGNPVLGAGLQASPGAVKMMLYWPDDADNTQVDQTFLTDDNTAVPVLTDQPITGGTYSRDLAGRLAPGKVAAARALVGQYQSTMTWTLTNGPQ